MKTGIWGFGVVGQTIFQYLIAQGNKDLLIYDDHDLSDNACLQAHNVFVVNDLNNFLEACDLIFPSPGIDLNPYSNYQSKFCAELDLFYQNWHKPIFAITGTLGKTTLTTLLTTILNQSQTLKTVAAGNVGVGMCSILGTDYDQVVLELSSFQLEQAKNFAPDVAIWTNLYPNHLDRHKTLKAYLCAKAKIFLQQTKHQITLLPMNLIGQLVEQGVNLGQLESQLYLFGQATEQEQLALLPDEIKAKIAGVFVLQEDDIVLVDLSNNELKVMKIANLKNFQHIDTYPVNLVILAAVCYLRKVILPQNLVFDGIAHRVEKFYTSANQIDFYNDSKSTVVQATVAAVDKLAGKPIILFLGGVSKGVDRSELVAKLVNKVKVVICFGAEAAQLQAMCEERGLGSVQFGTLEPALDYCLSIATTGDQVLFSPSGASFDLFKDYVQRGEIFKQLVLQKHLN